MRSNCTRELISKGSGTIGIITYLRTDSTRISDEADAAAREYIREVYGENFVAEGEKKKASEKKIQDAHEAIRPTDLSRTPASVKESLTKRSVSFVSVDLEAVCSKQDAAGEI